MNVTKKSVIEDFEWFKEDKEHLIGIECYFVAYDTAVEFRGLIFWACRHGIITEEVKHKWLEVAYHYIHLTEAEIISRHNRT